jgi:hypothetical protein
LSIRARAPAHAALVVPLALAGSAMARRVVGMMLLVAAGASLVLAAVLFVMVLRAGGSGGDFGARWLPRGAAAVGVLLGSFGYALVSGKPSGLESRRTSPVVLVALVLLLAALVLLPLLNR